MAQQRENQKSAASGISHYKALKLADRLAAGEKLELSEFEVLVNSLSPSLLEYVRPLAREACLERYGNKVFIRGLIEYTNYCKNDCYYCGIRCGNKAAQRYRLNTDQILDCCRTGYELGFRTFVLQGGEDSYFTDQRMAELIGLIKERYPDCALTLSIGEKSKESYEKFRNAGADRYLLRHETADELHYRKLHPPQLTLKHRLKCLLELKELGFQTGCGFMVGSPGQTAASLAQDLYFIQEFEPAMVGLGPFLPHKDTPFSQEKPGGLEMTLYLLALVRLISPDILLPATTALGTLHPGGRELGILSGANVVMPNLSPAQVRKKYMLYNDKICTGNEAAECLENLKLSMKSIGYEIVSERGDSRVANFDKS